MAQQRSHVPKFGNWDDDNVPYTAYFENARKDKVPGVRMNPNDPEENPEAFFFQKNVNGRDASNNNSSASVQKSLDKPTVVGRKQQKIVSLKIPAFESSSHKGNPENANLNNPKHQRIRSENKKSVTDNSVFFPRSPSPGSRFRGGSNVNDDYSYMSSTVPKFGAWDDMDPRSAEGFTVIFNKVKEEKQIAAAKLPTLQPHTPDNPRLEKRKPRSKMACCLF